MTVSLQRGQVQAVVVELRSGFDGQGKPLYSTPITVLARVVRSDVEQNTFNSKAGGGDELQSMVDLWVTPNYAPFKLGDRMTLQSGLVGIVMLAEEAQTLRRGLDHMHYQLREQ